MNAVVIEHVSLNELPAAWRDRLLILPNTRVTVRIEEEAEPTTQAASTENLCLGCGVIGKKWRRLIHMCGSSAHRAIGPLAPASERWNKTAWLIQH